MPEFSKTSVFLLAASEFTVLCPFSTTSPISIQKPFAHRCLALSNMISDSNDELDLRSSYSQITRAHFGLPFDGPPVLARNARGRERPEFFGSMKAVCVNETALNDERLVALARKLVII